MDHFDFTFSRRRALSEALEDNLGVALNVSRDLKSRASAFAMTGNQDMASYLTDLSEIMVDRAKCILAKYDEFSSAEGHQVAGEISSIFDTALSAAN